MTVGVGMLGLMAVGGLLLLFAPVRTAQVRPVGYVRFCGLLVLAHMCVRTVTHLTAPESQGALINVGRVTAATACRALGGLVVVWWVQRRGRS